MDQANREIPVTHTIPLRDIELVMDQTGKSYEQSLQALMLKDGDIVDAIMYLNYYS